MPRSKLRVGVTVSPAENVPAVLYSNGIHQNVLYLAQLLQKLPMVGETVLVAYPFDKHPLHPIGCAFNIPTCNLFDEALKLDVIVELGIRLEADFTTPYRKKGGKLVSYVAGNSMVMSIEHCFNKSTPGTIFGDGFDAVWITPQHWKQNASAFEMLAGPAREAPHIWSEAALKHSMMALGLNPHWRLNEQQIGKQGKRLHYRLGCFDPNVNVVKSFHIPLLVAEAANRRNPDLIDKLLLFNTHHFRDDQHFLSMVCKTSLGPQKVMSEARHGVAAMFGAHIDGVITHHWENGLNYLFWDTLYLGWPLIHNSEFIPDAGFYYPSWKPENGGEIMAEGLPGYSGPREADKEAVWKFHVDNPANQADYSLLLEEVLDARKIAA